MSDQELKYYCYPEINDFVDPITYILNIIGKQFGIKITKLNQPESSGISFGNTHGNYPIDIELYKNLCLFPNNNFIPTDGYLYRKTEKKQIDYIASTFYLLNVMQEMNPSIQKDQYHRFPYFESIQYKNGTILKDEVSSMFQLFLLEFGIIHRSTASIKRSILLTHDIDFLESGIRAEWHYWKKNPSLGLLFKLFRHGLGGRKVWNNLSQISKINHSYGSNSTFYILPRKGINNNVPNADYIVGDYYSELIGLIEKGNDIGLHKSSYIDQSIEDEAKDVPLTLPLSNRNHYFQYQLPQEWIKLDDSPIEIDTGLGFTNQYGLRNNYPYPFKPFGTDLIVVPMVLMDNTIYKYFPDKDPLKIFIEMTENWKYGYCVSILFHNNFLTNGSNHQMLKAYHSILEYCQTNDIHFTDLNEIKKDFS